ncbi:hypothetical protein BH10ACT11_BH10ACT11_15310 [soil metagenome]
MFLGEKLEASALRQSGRLALLSKRSTLLRLQADDRLIELTREGHDRAFEALVDRYQTRLHSFCRGMLGSNEDAEDILQEVFVAAHNAMLADSRAINARPWLYRIARNRCLNHLRKPVADGQDSMDILPGENGVSVADRVQKREDFRALISDVGDLAETQRTALLLREIDDLSYDEIAQAMDTTVPAVKSLLVRARMSLADATQGRKLTCDEVRLTLAEAAEGLSKASGAERSHIKSCDPCREYRNQLRSNNRALAAMAPVGILAAFQHFLSAKLGIGGAKLGAGGGASATGGTAAAGGAGAGAGTAGTVGAGAAAAGSSGGAFSLAGGAAGIIGTKAVAGMASVAILTAGAVEAKQYYGNRGAQGPTVAQVDSRAPSAPAAVVADAGQVEQRPHRFTGGPPAAQPSKPADAGSNTPASQKAPVDPAPSNTDPKPSAPADPAPVVETPVLSSTPEETDSPAAVGGNNEDGSGTGSTPPATDWPTSPGEPTDPGIPVDPPTLPPTTPSPTPVTPTPSPGAGTSPPSSAPTPNPAAPVGGSNP